VLPTLEKFHQYSPSWAGSQATSSNIGVLYNARISGFTVDLAAVRSTFDIDRTDYTLISVDSAGHASATTSLGSKATGPRHRVFSRPSRRLR
jgi:hypothetical protein